MTRREKLVREVEEAHVAVEVAQARRDRAIVAAVRAGATGPEVGKAAGLTRARVSQIVNATERGAAS